MSAVSTVAPFESCIGCMRGDTDTGLIVRGEAEYAAAFLAAKLGMTSDEASATVGVLAEEHLGCDPGTVPDGRFDYAIRVCLKCADEAGLTVGRVSSGELPGIAEPAGDEAEAEADGAETYDPACPRCGRSTVEDLERIVAGGEARGMLAIRDPESGVVRVFHPDCATAAMEEADG